MAAGSRRNSYFSMYCKKAKMGFKIFFEKFKYLVVVFFGHTHTHTHKLEITHAPHIASLICQLPASVAAALDMMLICTIVNNLQPALPASLSPGSANESESRTIYVDHGLSSSVSWGSSLQPVRSPPASPSRSDAMSAFCSSASSSSPSTSTSTSLS